MNFGGNGGNGNWGLDKSANSYVDYNMAHGKTPGGSGCGGGSGAGCLAKVVVFVVFFGSTAILLSSGVSASAAVFIALLLLAGVSGGLAGLLKLLARKSQDK
jgi:predicted phage tail protein